MFSKSTELAGFSLVALGLALYLAPAAGLIFGGFALVFAGATTDDDAAGLALRRSLGRIRYAWHRQLAKEAGVAIPQWKQPRMRAGWIPCQCDESNEDCPLCDGLGYVPDPSYRDSTKSPHPRPKVDPNSEQFWSRMADARRERSKVHDRTPALSRQPSNGDIERLA